MTTTIDKLESELDTKTQSLEHAIERVKTALESTPEVKPPQPTERLEDMEVSLPDSSLPSPIPFLGTHNATITVVSPKSGEHRTFSIKTVKNGGLEGKRIIALLSGPDNEDDYTGFGFVNDDGTVTTWKKYRGTQYEKYSDLFDRPNYWAARGVEYMPEGRCRRCNRKLTHPDSLMSGIGPECATKD